MSDDHFDRLFIYMQKEFGTVNKRLDTLEDAIATKDSISHLTDNDAEQSARDAQWNRLIEWAREVSKKTGVPLPDL